MSVPRCKKKKGGLNSKLKKMEVKWQNDLSKMELDATMNASKYAQLLVYFALERKFGFGVKRIGKIQQEINSIVVEMLEKKYDLEWVENHFKEKGITIEA